VATTFHFSYERFLINKLREEFGFVGTPIRIQVRRRAKGGGPRKESRAATPGKPRKDSKAGRRRQEGRKTDRERTARKDRNARRARKKD
jgi:hypothetical protein